MPDDGAHIFDRHIKCFGFAVFFAVIPYAFFVFPAFSLDRNFIVVSGVLLFFLMISYTGYYVYHHEQNHAEKTSIRYISHLWPWGVLAYPLFSDDYKNNGHIPAYAMPMLLASKLFLIWVCAALIMWNKI